MEGCDFFEITIINAESSDLVLLELQPLTKIAVVHRHRVKGSVIQDQWPTEIAIFEAKVFSLNTMAIGIGK